MSHKSKKKNLFLIFSTLCLILLVATNLKSVRVRERTEQIRRAREAYTKTVQQKVTRQTAPVTPTFTPVDIPQKEIPLPRYTQTEAYLSLPAFKTLVQKWYNNGPLTANDKKSPFFKAYWPIRNSYTKYAHIRQQILTREKEFANYYVFYTGQDYRLRPALDLNKFLYEAEFKTPVTDFVFLRSYKSKQYENLPEINAWMNAIIDAGKINKRLPLPRIFYLN